MLGKIISGFAGAKAAEHVSGMSEGGGALLGIGTAALVKRLGPVGLVAALAGGYAFKRYQDKQAKRAKARQRSKARPSAA